MAMNLEDTLNKFNRELINFDQHRQKYTEHYGELRNKLYSLWKAELGKLLKGSTLGGSYGDNLKVSMPDEFDLVIHLVFPQNDKIIVRPDRSRPGNVTLDMTQVMEAISDKKSLIYRQLQKLVNEKSLLLEDRLQNWLQSLMTQALNKMDNKIEVKKSISTLKYKKSGPAHTIYVEGPYKYSVDFVPAIKLTAAQSILAAQQKAHFGHTTHWDAIPKPLKPPQPDNKSFRASYYAAEHELLKDKGNLKSAVRLLKKFRDTKQNLGNLKSYFIKTVFLWEATKRDRSYWQSPLNEIFLEMMHKLANSLAPNKGRILFFWHPKLNMIADLSCNQRAEMFNCVSKGEYRFHRAAGNLTDDIKENMHSSFSNREERGIEKKPAHPKPKLSSEVCEKKTVETQTECKPKPNASTIANLQMDAKNFPSLPKSKAAPPSAEGVEPEPQPKENCGRGKSSEKGIVMPNPQLAVKRNASETKPKANGSQSDTATNSKLKPSSCDLG